MNTPIKLSTHSGRDDVRIMTLQAHILGEQAEHGHAGGTFSWILSALSISAKIIADKVRRARLENVLGSIGTENVQGEVQQKLDVLANDVLLGTLGGREGVAIVASEENEEPVILRDARHGVPRYCVLFDPLDGSSNLDVCGGVGTIFSILAHDGQATRAEDSLLQAGVRQIAAGYVLYGSSTVFVLTIGKGVDLFVLDPGIGAFMRVERNLKIPTGNRTYSVNEGNRKTFPPKAISAISIGPRATATRAATPVPWWRTCIASFSRAGCFSIRPPRKRPRGSCGSCTKPTRWP